MTIVIRFDRNALFRNALAERGMGMKDLAGKTAFVTGAASGIGLGIATAFAQAGVKVMLCDIEEAALAEAVEGLKRTNADVDGVRADISLKQELKAAGRRDHRPVWQGPYSRQQRGRRRRRALRRLDRQGLGLDDRGEPDGRRLGGRDLRAAPRTARRRRPYRLHRLDRRADLS